MLSIIAFISICVMISGYQAIPYSPISVQETLKSITWIKFSKQTTVTAMVILKAFLFCCFIPSCYMTTCPKEGTYYYKYSGLYKIFTTVPESVSSRTNCISACQFSRPRCIGMSYDQVNKTCDLLDRIIPGSSLEEESSKGTWVSGN